MTYTDLDSLGWTGEDGKDAWFICMLKSKKRKKKTYSQKKKNVCGAKGKEDIQNSVSGFTYALVLSYYVLSFPLPSEL